MDLKKIKQYADIVKQEDAGLDRRIIAKVVGVTFEGRQEILAKISDDTLVRLERDRRNKYDYYAVKVMAKTGDGWEQAGFLPRTMSPLVARSLDQGVKLSASVFRVLGGFELDDEGGGTAHIGLEIRITPER